VVLGDANRFDLFDWVAADGQFAALDFSAAPLSPGLRWDASQLYVDGSIAVTAVPEPGTAAMWLVGIAGMNWLARRRRFTPA
jgi:hypothetical protein